MSAARPRILMVEDEPTIRRAVVYALEREAFAVDAVDDGAQGLSRARAEPYDLVVLDLVLPGMPGLDVCRELRAESSVPILVLTARDTETDRVLGLELGADDYVTKPFSLVELISRVRAILRRRELDRDESEHASYVAGDLRVDLARHEVRVEGKRVRVTPSEFKLLALLAERREHVVTRREIVQHLWESSYAGSENVCEAHISNLRRKIERDRARPERIITVRGVGYKLVPVSRNLK
ncbi:MAG: response regulator transcription factor [Actinomycetota bacterium]|nr:response regulator transcription factor [Actinomycetota bacterium]